MADAGRVVAGSARGIRLLAPGEGTRPLTDRVKEALFGALEAAGLIGPGHAFLDLFAGSGAAGIEALSRGSSRALFVERDPGACRVIAANLARTGLAGGTVVRADAVAFLRRDPAACGAPFSCGLVDPPYESGALAPVLDQLAAAAVNWLTADGVVVTKQFWRDAPPAQTGSLWRYRERRFGETMLTFYRLGEAEGER